MNPLDTQTGGDHYKTMVPQPIEVIWAWDLPFTLGNVVKYVARAPYKGDYVENLEKAIHYLQLEIERHNGQSDGYPGGEEQA